MSGLLDLECFLRTNEIDYILSGSVGLFLQGFIPPSYLPHDIDIRIPSNSQSNTKICDFFNKVSKYSVGEKNPIDEYPEQTFTFYVKNNMIKVNAFVCYNQNSPENKTHLIYLNNCKFKVHDVMAILQKKYAMKREKDFLFNNQIQMAMNSFFVNNK